MKKVLISLIFLLLPTIVNANQFGGVYGNKICIDANNVNPEYNNPACVPNRKIVIPESNFSNALLSIGALWAQTGDIDSAADAYRVFVANSNNYLDSPSDWQPDGYKSNKELFNAVKAGYGIISSTAQNMYNEALRAYNGMPNNELLNTFSSDNSNVEIKSTWTEIPSKQWTDSSKYYSKKLLLNLNITSGTPNSVTVTSCSLDSKSASSGFKVKCDNKVNFTNGSATQEVIIYTDGLVYNDNNDVKVTVNYTINKKSAALIFEEYSGMACVPERFKIPALNYGNGYPNALQRFVSLETVDNSKNLSSTYALIVSKTCNYNDDDGNPHYYFHITHPGESTEDIQEISALEYMKKGCCADVLPKYFKSDSEEDKETIRYYKENCMTKDLVSFENDCGVNSCDGENKYKSYSNSFVWQVPIATIKSNFLKNTSFENINNAHETLKYYYNENLSNNYCKILTSEENEIYFPTTAVASSGRFFIFQELDKTKCDMTGLNYNSKNCFRQPHVKGIINLYVINNYNEWLKQYNTALSEQKKYCNSTSGNEKENLLNQDDCTKANLKIKELENAKTSCENAVNNFNYDLEPTLKFYYEQQVPEINEPFAEEVNMYATKQTDEPVKYWPNVTTTTQIYNPEQKPILKYSFSSNNDYQIAYTKTVYYRPSINSFSLLPSGAIATNKYETVGSVIENGIDIGYVYNVNVTTYEGIYNTWFDISNLGNGKEKSNLNKMVISEYKTAQKINDLKSTCKYCNEEGAFYRECPTCEELNAKFIFRNINLQDVMPNEREHLTNWTDDKGLSATKLIESTNSKTISKTNTDLKTATLLNDSKDIADIYSDPDKTYLEYEIILTSEDIKTIRKNNKKQDYSSFTLCNSASTSQKSEDETYCYKCNKDGKECESTFINAYSNMNITTNTRKEKWKYYFYNPNTKTGEFKKGSMTTIEEFENGRYPDPENQLGYINTYKNWP